MILRRAYEYLIPGWKSAILSLLSAGLLTLAFPDFDIPAFAFVALVPLFLAVSTEFESFSKSFVTGWIFGTAIFTFTCWWLTFAPVTYAGFPVPLAYALLLGACAAAGLFPAIACGLISIAIKRFGGIGLFAAPFVWVGAEHLRLGLTGNNWNTIGYSQAFTGFVEFAAYGGVGLVGAIVLLVNTLLAAAYFYLRQSDGRPSLKRSNRATIFLVALAAVSGLLIFSAVRTGHSAPETGWGDYERVQKESGAASIIAVQPNVPMNGLDRTKWRALRDAQFEAAANALAGSRAGPEAERRPAVVILPESPMNFQYEEDPEFRRAVTDFAVQNKVSVLFNSAEPDRRRQFGFFNSAVMVDREGKKAAQYDKIYLLPFGEFVPLPEFAQDLIPPMVGRFSSGSEYDLLPFGAAKGGIMICFESHFASLSREYAARGADILVEMTNDGYLGPTPVLRQHLANAAFRAAETARPLVRVTNVGVTAFVTERGEVLNAADVYEKDTRVWNIRKSEGKITFFVRYGDWFAWLCVIVAIGLTGAGLIGRKAASVVE